MKIGIFDLETSGLKANSSILLCCSIKEYGKKGVKTVRADKFKSWKLNRTNEEEFIKAVADELDKFDILIAHNGEKFDKKYLNTKCVKYDFRPILRFKKLIDPLQLSWKHISLERNSLASLIDYFRIPVKKTPIEYHLWLQTALEGNSKSMNVIVKHCEHDVITLELVYDRVRSLIDKVDTRGSAF